MMNPNTNEMPPRQPGPPGPNSFGGPGPGPGANGPPMGAPPLPNSRAQISGPQHGVAPPMDAMNKQFRNLNIDTDVRGRQKDEFDSDDPFDRNTRARDDCPTYEGWTLYRGKAAQDEKLGWSHITRSRMHLSQDELASLVKKRKAKTVSQEYRSMSRLKREKIDRLIEDRKYEDNDPGIEWACVYIDAVYKDVRRSFFAPEFVTTCINLVLEKRIKPGLSLPSPRLRDGERRMSSHEGIKLDGPSRFDDNDRRDSFAPGMPPPQGGARPNPQFSGMPSGGPHGPHPPLSPPRQGTDQIQGCPPGKIPPPPGPPQGGPPHLNGGGPPPMPPPVGPPPSHGPQPPQGPPPFQQPAKQRPPPPQGPPEHDMPPQARGPRGDSFSHGPPPPGPPPQPRGPSEDRFSHGPPSQGPPPAPPAPPPPPGPIKDRFSHGPPPQAQRPQDRDPAEDRFPQRKQNGKMPPKIINPESGRPSTVRSGYDMLSSPEGSIWDNDSARFDDDADFSATDEEIMTPDDHEKCIRGGRRGIGILHDDSRARSRSRAPHSRSRSRSRGPGHVYPRRVEKKSSDPSYPQGVVDVIPGRSMHRPKLERSLSVAHPARFPQKAIYNDREHFRQLPSPVSPLSLQALSPPMKYMQPPFVDDIVLHDNEWELQQREAERLRHDYMRTRRLQEKEDELEERELDLKYREMRLGQSGKRGSQWRKKMADQFSAFPDSYDREHIVGGRQRFESHRSHFR